MIGAKFFFRLLIEDLHVFVDAVQPDHRPAESLGKGDDVFGAAQPVRRRRGSVFNC